MAKAKALTPALLAVTRGHSILVCVTLATQTQWLHMIAPQRLKLAWKYAGCSFAGERKNME